MNVVYSNICGGLIFAGEKYGEMLFRKISLENYVGYFAGKAIDILSLSEAHLEDTTSSQMVDRIAHELDMPYHAVQALDASPLDTSKQFGMAVISKYPIIRQEDFTIPSPKIEVDRPNGEHWIMQDKGGQRVYLDTEDGPLAVVNFSYFPFHHFNRSTRESEFDGLRQELMGILLRNETDTPTIITGDLNNKGHRATDAFPELFAHDTLRQAVNVPTTVVGFDHEQLDHILYPPDIFTASASFAELNGSDHYAIGATLLRR